MLMRIDEFCPPHLLTKYLYRATKHILHGKVHFQFSCECPEYIKVTDVIESVQYVDPHLMQLIFIQPTKEKI